MKFSPSAADDRHAGVNTRDLHTLARHTPISGCCLQGSPFELNKLLKVFVTLAQVALASSNIMLPKWMRMQKMIN